MKKFMLICAPISSRSGYGDHARDLFHSFYSSGKFDIKVYDVRWGDCPMNALNPSNYKDKIILDSIQQDNNLPIQPDVYVDIRIPNEFLQVGKFNIGITAGIETTSVSQTWLEGCNKMDLIIVPSEHSKQGFVSSIYDKIQNHPDGRQESLGELKLETPIEVLFEGVNVHNYKPLKKNQLKLDISKYLSDDIPEEFLFLFVGQWGPGDFGNDRKDIGKLIKIFIESFANKKKQPALLLKTNGASFSTMDRSECIHKINGIKDLFPSDWVLPSIYLLHGDLSTEEMNEMYNHPKVKSMVSLTHGEGFGRPLLEATMVGLPVIASNWSGQTDFLDTNNSILLAGKLTSVPKSAIWKEIIIKESKWFVVDDTDVYKSLNYAFTNSDGFKSKAEKLMIINNKKFTLDKMTDGLVEILDKHLKSMPTEVGLKLPKLKKINKSEPPKIKLPKLTRV